MANLTDYLPAVQDGKRITQPYDPGPSIFEGLARLGSVVEEGLQGAAQTRARREAARRQAEQDRLDASDRGAKNLAASTILGVGTAEQALEEQAAVNTTTSREENSPIDVDSLYSDPFTSFTPPSPVGDTQTTVLDPDEFRQLSAAQDTGTQIGQRAAQWKQGVAQGRISAQQYEMLLESALREGFRLFPDSKYVMLEKVKEYVDHPIMSEYTAARKELERQEEAESKREENAIDFAVQSLGMAPDLPRGTLIAAGNKGMADKFTIEQARATYDFNRKTLEDNREDTTALNEAHDAAVGKYTHSQLSTQFGAVLDQFNSIMQDQSIPEADRLKAASDFVNVFKPKAYSLIDNTLLTAVNQYGMTQKTADSERERLRSQVDDIFAQFSSDNPLNMIVTNGKILQTMKDKFQLDLTDAMPVYMQFKQAFGNSDSVQTLVDTIAADPGLQSVFTRELKGFNGLAHGDQTMRLRNLIAFVTDRHTGLRDYSVQESAQILKDSSNLLNGGIYKQAREGDQSAQNTVLNTLGKVSNAAIDLNQGSSTRTLVNALNFVANGPAFAVFENLTPENKEFGNLVVDETRVAAGKVLMSLIGQNQTNPYWKVALDDKNHRFVLQKTGATVPKPQGTGFSKTEMGSSSTPPPSDDLRAQVTAMNRGLRYLLATTKYEDNSTLKNATYDEKYRFYTRGELPKQAVTKESTISGRERISRLQDYWENVKIDWSKVPQVDIEAEVERSTGTAPQVDTSRPFEANIPTIMRAEGTSQAKGWDTILGDRPDGTNDLGVTPPKPVTKMTMDEVVNWARKVLLPASGALNSSAVGGLQITTSNIMKFAPQLFGEKWKDKLFSKEAQIAIAKAIHAEQGYGAWEGLKR